MHPVLIEHTNPENVMSNAITTATIATIAGLPPIDLARSNLPTMVDRLGILLGAVADLQAQADAIKDIIKGQVPVGSAAEGSLFRAAVGSANRLVLDKAKTLQYLREQFGVELDDGEYQLQLCKPVESISVRIGARKA
jgi:hypothetical protein